MPGTLIVAATPIGNAKDASPRLAAALATATHIAAEDTRRLRRLATDLGVSIRGRTISFFDGNESARLDGLVHELLAGSDVLLVSDAGMPGISDPGYRLVDACAERGIPVTVLPGPSAVMTALVVSGLPTDRFVFEGFLPRRSGERGRRLSALATETRTMVFFEAGRRVAQTLQDMAVAFGEDRRVAICRELTKIHEEVRRGTLTGLAPSEEVLGEVTIVVAGADPALPALPEADEWRRRVESLRTRGLSRRDAIAQVAREEGVPRHAVYEVVHHPGSSQDS